MQISLRKGVLRYLTLRQLFSYESKRLNLLICIITTLQLATLLVPVADTPELPWRYDLFWPVWALLNAVARPDRLTLLLVDSTDLPVYALTALTALRLFSSAALVLHCSFQRSDYYWQLINEKRITGAQRHLWRLDYTLLVVTARLLSIPTENQLVSAIVGRSGPAFFTAVAAFPVATALSLADAVVSCDVMVRANNHGPITPSHSLILRCADFVAAVVVPVCLHTSHDFLVRTLLLACGLVKAVYVYRDLPFHSVWRNAVESFQGVILVWEVAVLTLAMNTEKSTAPALLLICASPLLFAINFSLVREFISRPISPVLMSEAQHAHLLRSLYSQPILLDSKKDSLYQVPALRGIWLEKMDLYPLLWTAYYFLYSEETHFLKMAMAAISNVPRSPLDTVAVEVLFARGHSRLEQDADEFAVQRFLRLNRLQDRLQGRDYAASFLLKELLLRLQTRLESFERIVKTARVASKQLRRTLELYRKSIDIFPKKVNLLKAYMSLLEMIGRSEDSQSYKNMILRLSVIKRRRPYSAEDRLLVDDPKCIVFVVALTGPQQGQILWALNAEALGYTDDSIRGQDHNVLVPEAFRSTHINIVHNIMKKRTVPRILQSSYKMYIVSYERELLFGTWRVFVSIDKNSRQLIAVASIRLEQAPKEFAIAGPFGGVMECTTGFADMMRSSRFREECSGRKDGVIWKGIWNTAEMMVIRDDWNLLDHLHIPIFVLYRLRSRRTGVHLPQPDLNSLTKTVLGSQEHQLELFFTRVSRTSNAETVRTDAPQEGNSRAIVSYRIKRRQVLIRRYRRLLLFLLLCVFLSNFAISFSVFSLFHSRVSALDESIASISSFGMRRLSIRLAQRSKELFLANANYTLFGNETAAREDLRTGALQMMEMKKYLLGNISSAQGAFRNLLLEQTIPLWKHQDSGFVLYFVTLLDLMDTLAHHSLKLSSTPLPNITSQNSDFLTLYRSSASEGLSAFNLTVSSFCESKDEEREEVLGVLKLAAVAGPCALVTAALVTAVPLLLMLEASRRKVWAAIGEIPLSAVAEGLALVHTRLAELHQDEDLATHSLHPTHNKRMRYRCSPHWQALFCLVTAYCVVAPLCGLGLYLLTSAEMDTILRYKPTYMDYLGLRRVLAAKSQFLMRESWLPRALAYPTVVPEVQAGYELLGEWSQAYVRMRETNHCFEVGCRHSHIRYLFPSAKHKDLLMGAPCQDCETMLKAGITPLVNEVAIASAEAKAAVLKNDTGSYSKGKKIEKQISTLLNALTTSNDQFNADCKSSLSSSSEMILRILCVSECLLALFLLALIVPLLLYVSRSVETELRTLTFFPKAAIRSAALRL